MPPLPPFGAPSPPLRVEERDGEKIVADSLRAHWHPPPHYDFPAKDFWERRQVLRSARSQRRRGAPQRAGAEQASFSAPAKTPSLEEFHAARRRTRRSPNKSTRRWSTTFVSQLEKEDIEVLSAALYKIPKTVEKFAERFIISCADGQGRGLRQAHRPAGRRDASRGGPGQTAARSRRRASSTRPRQINGQAPADRGRGRQCSSSKLSRIFIAASTTPPK